MVATMSKLPPHSSTSTTTPTDLAPAIVDVAVDVVEALAKRACLDATEHRVYIKALRVLERYFDSQKDGE